ncbi:hypothetical protein ACSU64_20960 [Bacillaceae bacterium C204]|uniref:hypothetical protein n=1 Tax=Neobacillus sp. 204 TaxID=3383351 RepID=UPI00397E5B54
MEKSFINDMDEQELIRLSRNEYMRNYLRDYRKQNPEKIKKWQNDWLVRRVMTKESIQSMSPREKASFELEQLKHRGMEVEAKEVLNNKSFTIPTFY